jgi:hypothetical protein
MANSGSNATRSPIGHAEGHCAGKGITTTRVSGGDTVWAERRQLVESGHSNVTDSLASCAPLWTDYFSACGVPETYLPLL